MKGPLILVSYFFLISLVCVQDLTSKKNTLCWCEDRKLEWKDFQGTPDSGLTYLGTKAIAKTASEISVIPFSENGIPRYRVIVTFNKKKSWTTTDDLYSLAHEQLHFDISELFGRKIRRVVNQNMPQDSLMVRVNGLLKELSAYQDSYDKATVHGEVDFMQEIWNNKVKNQLDELKEYASSSEDCR